ncbi:MAG: ATP synthase subunit I [Lachnospiraceae bacterium]|nr:ATP synthase subunit I [Lachnospiraceae bacterium]MBO4904205.1 ATP synthase subunit I [Lachnospiraceae bacterium]
MNRLRIILRENHTLHEMMTGIAAANAVLAIIALLVDNRRAALTAVAIGTITAIVYTIHMAVTVDDALCLDEKGAAAQLRKNMLIRYLFVCVVVAVSLYTKVADPVFMVISVITIKAGAYLQPFVHRIFSRRKDN